MNLTPLHGLVAAAHTPFHPDGSLATECVSAQASHLAGCGIRAVFITGSTGEAHSLTRNERLAVYAAWAENAPRHGLRVIAHAGSNCLGEAKTFAAPLYLKLIAARERGDMATAGSLQLSAVGMIDAMAAIGYMGAAKAVMEWLGVPVGPVRPPLENPRPEQLDALRRRLDELGVPGAGASPAEAR